MPCYYCMRLEKIQNELTKLNNENTKISNAKTSLTTVKSGNSNVDLKLGDLTVRMQTMATPDNMDSCVKAIKDLNKDSSSSIDSMIKQCTDRINQNTSKIKNLQSEQKRLKKEDADYHKK